MEQMLSICPFIPAKDRAVSQRFYQALGFKITHADKDVALLKQESHSFILQNYCVEAYAGQRMMQWLVRKVDVWWRTRVDAASLEAEFHVKPSRPPAMQDWGLKVGFIFDPSGVLIHVAESPF